MTYEVPFAVDLEERDDGSLVVQGSVTQAGDPNIDLDVVAVCTPNGTVVHGTPP